MTVTMSNFCRFNKKEQIERQGNNTYMSIRRGRVGVNVLSFCLAVEGLMYCL